MAIGTAKQERNGVWMCTTYSGHPTLETWINSNICDRHYSGLVSKRNVESSDSSEALSTDEEYSTVINLEENNARESEANNEDAITNVILVNVSGGRSLLLG